MTVSAVVRGDNATLIAEVAKLWIGPDDIVLDPTYGRGLWWTRYRPDRLIVHDLALDGVDFRQLPEEDASVDVVAFDPPYVATGGRCTSTIPEFNQRYGLVDAPATPALLRELVGGGMKEHARVIRPGGRLLVKCMDYVSSGRLQLGRHHVVATALALGLEQVDEFIHLGGTRAQPQHGRQVHARHNGVSFLCVFKAPRRSRPLPSSTSFRSYRKGGTR